MRLKRLIKSLDNCLDYPCPEDFEVEGIACDSKKVLNNYLFVAIKGTKEDGHKFIPEAIQRGAKAVVVQNSKLKAQKLDKASFFAVRDTRNALAKLAAEFYAHPSKKMKVIGITGTNGKTTLSYLIEALLKEANFISAVIGTINYRFGKTIIPSKNTTPGPIELQYMLAEALNQGIRYAIMETSSHALAQERIKEIDFHSAIFTNLTQDHLDYHRTLENYFRAKAKLFQEINAKSLAIFNQDDKYAKKLKELTKAKIITYGIEHQADVMAKDIKFSLFSTEFILANKKSEIKLKTGLFGRHNVYNILAAISWALKEGLDLSLIKSAVEKFSSVPGRLEKIDFAGDFSVFVDYAHTEDALRNVIGALRQLPCKRIIVVFGCGGERDRTKRPKMGRLVSELADYAIITNDNPRSESPEKIIEEIKSGIKKGNYSVIPERLEAIRKALSLAKRGDIVLVAGKGHENYQLLNNGMVYFDDREVVRECLKSLNY